ncbi:putative olfactory receptor 2W6 [Tachyglossus aculeatus]|uniref:putative olfactory receptor 2W6 n=1 Tax=Tachyglossus aculeatus TaxID=9261 RepID=UPI0018F53702|nr:putative olfactory receptor 2W6 [Tachyglossus aculeatus]
MKNQTAATSAGFILLGFSTHPAAQLGLFLLSLLLFLLILLGNLTIVLLAWTDSVLLSAPMYFFLGHFSLLEMGFTSITVPKLLTDSFSSCHLISFAGCATQTFFFIALGSTECALLAVMAYDRYVAVCRPLRYPQEMRPEVCAQLVAGAWLSGFFNSTIHTAAVFRLSFCGYACEAVVLTFGSVYGLTAILVTLASYARVLFTVLGMGSTPGQYRAFSTCSSHLAVVGLFYGSAFSTYVQTVSACPTSQVLLLPFFYALVTPTLNPFIYSLRNREVKQALIRTLGRKNMHITAQIILKHPSTHVSSTSSKPPKATSFYIKHKLLTTGSKALHHFHHLIERISEKLGNDGLLAEGGDFK